MFTYQILVIFLMKIFRDSQENIVLHFRKRYKLLQHLKNKLGSFYSKLLKILLPNQVPLPDKLQDKCWDPEVCGRERVYSHGSQGRKGRTSLRFSSLKARCLEYLWVKRIGWLEVQGKVTGGRKKSEVIPALCSHIWLKCFFMGCMFTKWWH